MRVAAVRIDDRLIHGQVVTAWIGAVGAKAIIVADDVAATDQMQQMLLKMATPAALRLLILPISKVMEFLTSDSSNDSALVIVRTPAAAHQLLDEGLHVDSINVGNISNSRSLTGRTKLLQYIYVEELDIQHLRAIAARNVKLDARAIPADRSLDPLALIEKHQ